MTGDFTRIHDPSRIITSDGKYYLYYTGDRLPMRTSSDMLRWTSGPPVFEKVPDWVHEYVPAAKGNFVWAPDVILVKGEYWLFYSYSTFGSPVSAIGLVSSPTLDPESPDYKWTDKGLVISSNEKDGFNAIDPAPIWDEKGDLWLTFGSWQRNGIQLVPLDKTTGKSVGKPTTLARGQELGPEAAYLHFRDGYYYLFENEGECCKAMNSTYRVMVGRSKNITGPYLDKTGKDLAQAGGTLFLETKGAEIGPGHIGIYSENSIERVTFHYYDGRANGSPTLGSRSLVWDEQGWPIAVPDLPSGQYTISSKGQDNVLTTQGRPGGNPVIREAPAGTGRTQAWNVISLANGYYSLSSLGSGRYVTASPDGTQIDLQPWTNMESQQWRLEAVEAGVFRLTNRSSKAALSTSGGIEFLTGEKWNKRTGQQWIFRPLP